MKRKTIKNKLDKIFSLKIRERGRCERCGKTNGVQLQCAHIYSRANLAVRWDLLNALCLCAGCHFYTHQHPVEFSDLVRDILGVKYKVLRKKANTIKKWTDKDLNNLLLKLCQTKVSTSSSSSQQEASPLENL